MSELPSGYQWGIAKRSRFQPKPPRHLVTRAGGVAQVICSGAPALIENSAGRDCRECLRWLAQYEQDETTPHPEDTRVHYGLTVSRPVASPSEWS